MAHKRTADIPEDTDELTQKVYNRLLQSRDNMIDGLLDIIHSVNKHNRIGVPAYFDRLVKERNEFEFLYTKTLTDFYAVSKKCNDLRKRRK